MDALTAKYRKLLVAEESLSNLDQCLSLVESALGANIEVQSGQIVVKLAGKQSIAGAEESLAAIPRFINLAGLNSAAEGRRKTARNREREARVLRSVLDLSVVPVLAWKVEPELSEAQYSLVKDSCLLLFHQVYFALLPEFGEGWEVERESVLRSFSLLAGISLRAADRFHVLALEYDARNNVERAAKLYRAVVEATPSDAHDFMSCLQSAWSYLIEHERTEEAFNLLVDNMPRVTLADQDEFRTLLKQTFSLAQSTA
jgi:hypothetical protein